MSLSLRGALLASIVACVVQPAFAQERSFDLPEQPAVTGIPAFAKQAGIQIIAPASGLGDKKTRAVHGTWSIDAALAMLLQGTGLQVTSRSDSMVSLAVAPQTVPAPTKPRQDPAPAAPGGANDNDALSTVIVTGTHIARPELESAMPVAVMKMDDAKNFGYETAYDALLLNPAVGPGLGNANSQGDTWDVGVANINLRNMGVNRTLVLVDGERWVSGGARTSAVDLNTIPDAMIDRFEVVTGGAAAIYGPDAVTGAVNIIMKKDITGLNVSAISGLSQHGDANQISVSATTGLKFGDADRGSFVIGGTYTHTAPLRDSARYPDRVSYVANPAYTGPNSGVPATITRMRPVLWALAMAASAATLTRTISCATRRRLGRCILTLAMS